MTSEPKPRPEFRSEDRPNRPTRKIWGEEGLVEDKQQESRMTSEKRNDRRGGDDRPDRGGRPPRGGRRS